jgi:tRNA pseudouridine55 synthase
MSSLSECHVNTSVVSPPIFAAINIYKPLEWTSHDVVARLRRLFGLKRIGHLGTLDPLAEGVLPVCLGQATRLIEYFPSDKRYRATVTLGRTTATLDAEGKILSQINCQEAGIDLSPSALETALKRFRGAIQQQVPLYSAVHVNGKKLYKLAREGKTADLPVRETVIHELTLTALNQDNLAHPVLTLDVHCSSGTYIRSLARDIGIALGCGAYLSGLVRTAHGHFPITQSVTLETLQASKNPHDFLCDPIPYLEIPIIHLATPEQARLLRTGMKTKPDQQDGTTRSLKSNTVCMTLLDKQPVGITQLTEGKLKPVKIFPLTI